MLPPEQHISLKIGIHTLSMKIPREQEPLYRKAAITLNERYKFYQTRMKTASAEQLWLYVALEMAVNMQTKNQKSIDENIQLLNRMIEETLNI